MTVWANGNDGDNGQNQSNPPGQDPTPGVISVASYNDQETGTRDGVVSDFSSRGDAARSQTWPDISAPGENIQSSCRAYLPICSSGLKPTQRPRRRGHRHVQHHQRYVDGGTAHRGHHRPAVPGQPDATPAQVEAAMKSTAHKFNDGAAYDANGTSVEGASHRHT